jgi:hypothetical protein
MKIEQLIDDEVKKQLKYKTKLVKKRQQKRNKEKLSQRDIEDLMGINRDIYTRGKGGAIRRK